MLLFFNLLFPLVVYRRCYTIRHAAFLFVCVWGGENGWINFEQQCLCNWRQQRSPIIYWVATGTDFIFTKLFCCRTLNNGQYCPKNGEKKQEQASILVEMYHFKPSLYFCVLATVLLRRWRRRVVTDCDWPVKNVCRVQSFLPGSSESEIWRRSLLNWSVDIWISESIYCLMLISRQTVVMNSH